MQRRRLVVLIAGFCLAAAPPRGQRAERPRATHVLVESGTLAVSGLKATLSSGVAVSARGGKAGKAEVVVVDGVELRGSVDATKLGLRVAKDAELRAEHGSGVVGVARAGAFVRVVKTTETQSLVDAVGDVAARGWVDKAFLTADAAELVLRENWNGKAARSTIVMGSADGKGEARAHLAAGAPLVLIEKDDRVVRVRTHGAFEVEGYVALADVVLRAATDVPVDAPPTTKPTHEIFVDAPFFADAQAKKNVGTLHGGTLVVREPQLDLMSPFAKVRIEGRVTVTGWVKQTDLRALDAVWTTDKPFSN